MREDRGPHLRLAQGPQELNPALSLSMSSDLEVLIG